MRFSYSSFTKIFSIEAIFSIRLLSSGLLYFGQFPRAGDVQQFGMEQTKRRHNTFITNLKSVFGFGLVMMVNNELFFSRSAYILQQHFQVSVYSAKELTLIQQNIANDIPN